MESILPFLSAFVVGLLGGVHCVGMCGGIVGALSYSLPTKTGSFAQSTVPHMLAYNLGRMLSYVVAGALMGGVGLLLAQFMPIYVAQQVLLILAGLFMLLLGLYLSGWWMLLSHVEQLGSHVWKRLEPISKRLLPIRSPRHAFLVGIIWGWVPCGLVYSMLINAVATGSFLKGGGLMLAFALGTLPNLLAMGFLVGAAAKLGQSLAAKRVAGITVMAFGTYSLYQAIP